MDDLTPLEKTTLLNSYLVNLIYEEMILNPELCRNEALAIVALKEDIDYRNAHLFIRKLENKKFNEAVYLKAFTCNPICTMIVDMDPMGILSDGVVPEEFDFTRFARRYFILKYLIYQKEFSIEIFDEYLFGATLESIGIEFVDDCKFSSDFKVDLLLFVTNYLEGNLYE